MSDPLELGKGIADTNSAHGPHRRTFHAVYDDGKRVSIDATNRTILIEKANDTGSYIKGIVEDDEANLYVQKSDGAQFKATSNGVDSLMDVIGGSGQIRCRTALCNGKILFPREEIWCHPDTGAQRKIMVLCSEPYD